MSGIGKPGGYTFSAQLRSFDGIEAVFVGDEAEAKVDALKEDAQTYLASLKVDRRYAITITEIPHVVMPETAKEG